MDAAVNGPPSHRGRVAERGRVAPVGDARPVLPVDPAVLERIGAVNEAKLRARRLERPRAELRRLDVAAWGYDGAFEANMVVSVESYIGETGGPDDVKLEEQVPITGRGAVPFSRSPLVDALQV